MIADPPHPPSLDVVSDPRRLAALRRIELPAGGDADLDRITRMAATQLTVPGVILSLVDAERESAVSGAGPDWGGERSVPLTHSLGKYVVADAGALIVGDARTVPWLRGHPAVAELDTVAYAGHPLFAQDRPIGVFAVFDREPRAWTEDELALIRDHAELAQAELDRRAARTDAREVSALLLRLQGLADATSTARELDGLLDDIVAACVDTFDAELAVIDLVDGHGALLARAQRGLAPEASRRALALRAGFAGRAGTAPQTIAIADLAEEADEPGAAALLASGVRSLLAAPLIVDHRLRGAVYVGAAPPGALSELDRQLLAVSADRFASVIVRAQRYERDRHIAATLVAALQPALLPDVPGIRLAGRYVPAERGLGGDWYDAFLLPGGALGVAIGDIVGHGIEGAVEGVRLRNALRGAVLAGHNVPETVLALNAHAAAHPGAHASTMVYLELDPPARRLRWASAGHVPGVIVEHGRAEWLGLAGGPPLGVVEADTWASEERTLAPDARILVFTDGLVERRTEALDVGINRVAAIAAEAPDLETLCERALSQAPTPRFDDLALIALELP